MKVFGIFGNTGYIGIRNDARYEEYVEYWGYSEYVWILMISAYFGLDVQFLGLDVQFLSLDVHFDVQAGK